MVNRRFLIVEVSAVVFALIASPNATSQSPQPDPTDYTLDEQREILRQFGVEDFKPMTDVQAAELALKKLDDVNRAIAATTDVSGVASECDGPKFQVARRGADQPKDTVAVCMLTDAEVQELAAAGMAPVEVGRSSGGSGLRAPGAKRPVVTWELSTGNDANFVKFGAQRLRGEEIPVQKLNDDVGRTFDISLKRRSTTDEGYTETRFDSTGFGQRGMVNGNQRDPNGRPFMKLYSVTSLAVESGVKIGSPFEGGTDFRVVEGSVEVATGKGKSLLGTELQNWFHETTGTGPTYTHLDHAKTKTTLTLKGGLSRMFEGDLVAFRCKLVGTGLVGIGTDGKPVAEGRVQASINSGSLGGRTADNPWIQLDAYRTHLIKQGGRPEEKYGVRLSTSVEVLGTRVKPFLGVSRNDGPLDRQYAAGSRGGRREPYFTTGFLVEWK